MNMDSFLISEPFVLDDDDICGDIREWLDGWGDEGEEYGNHGDNSESTVVAVVKPKKPRHRPNRKRNYVSAPRIVKHDVRRFYGVMIANVFNSYNLDILHSFYETYCHNLVHARKEYDSGTTYDFHTRNRNEVLSNIMGLVTWSALIQQFSPDQTLRIKNMRVITRSDSCEAKIVIDWICSLTNMYDWCLESILDDMTAAACALASSESQRDTSGIPIIHTAINVEDAEEQLRGLLGDMVTAVQNNRSTHPSTLSLTSSDTDSTADESVMRMLTPHVVINDQRKLRKPDVFGYYYRTRGKPVGLLPVPQKVEMPTRLVLYVNGQRQIVRMVFGADAMQET